MGQNLYKVLWLEDENNRDDGEIQQEAPKYSLNLVRFSNWENAKEELERNFDDYYAIVLNDCRYISKGNSRGICFLISIVPYDLTPIFERKKRYVPWYIYSAETRENETFKTMIEAAEFRRGDFNDEWGKMLFEKRTDGVGPLFRQIRDVADMHHQNTVLYRHEEVFKYLGKDKLIGYPKARKYMRSMLSALYFPEENPDFQYETTPVRKVLEYVFRTAYSKGLLPKECFKDKKEKKLNLARCRLFMEGVAVKYNNEDPNFYVQWRDNENGNIFPPDIKKYVKEVLDFAGAGVHTDEEYGEVDLIYKETKEGYFSYVMQLCCVIRWFGEYVNNGHNDPERNRKNHYYGKFFDPTRRHYNL